VEFRHQTYTHPGFLPSGMMKLMEPLRYGPGGWLGLAFCLAGFWRLKGQKAGRALMLITLLYLLPVYFTRQPFFRYTLPALPFLAVLAAVGIMGLESIKLRAQRLLLMGAAVGACLLPGLITAVRIDALLAREDTRTLSGRWIVDHVDPGVPVVVYGRPEEEPQLTESRASLVRRVEEMKRIYPGRAGVMFSEIHRLRLNHGKPPDRPGYEIHRNPAIHELKEQKVCVVIPSYPPGLAGFDGKSFSVVKRAETRMEFKALSEGKGKYRIDRTDGFYLPFAPLDRVIRPGPNLEVVILNPKRRQ
jgi:hypothetical protein